MQTHNERGIALILALFLMSALSVLGASLMFLSQTETYASMNYRTMSQTRYAAESGVNKAGNFLSDPTQYAVPTAVGGTDPMSNYDDTKSPVVCLSGCPNNDPNNPNHYVILSASPTQASNYPVAAVQTAFDAAAQGTLAAGASTLTYKTYATLMSMQKFDSYGGTQSVVQSWQITSDGGITGSSKATVRVTATVETPKVIANSMAAFATYNGCDAIQFHGNMKTDSYDSSLGPPTGAGNSQSSSDGDVGTNGNLHLWGSADVYGNLYTPRTGVGTCTAGAVTGLTEGGSANVNGSMVQLPKAVTYPAPVFSVTPPTNTVTITDTLGGSGPLTAANCVQLGLTALNCSASGTTLTINGGGADVTLPSVVVASGYTLVIKGAATPGQSVNINSLTGSNGSNIEFQNNGTASSVVLKVAGKNADGSDMTTPFDLTVASWKQNNTGTTNYDASALQIVYNGPGTIAMQGGNSQSAATIYAPNAAFSLQGTQDLFGSILAKTIVDGGNASIHYDRRLSRDFYVAGQPMMGTFSWVRAQ